jgi:hypothetical protein
MVLAPPSRKGDRAYRWVNQLPIAEAPQWILELIQEGRERTSNGAWGVDADGLSGEFLAEMAADAGQGVPEEETPAEKLRLALAVIPPTNRDERINFGRALYRWSGGSEEGFALFAEWLSLRDADGKQWWPEFVEVNAHRVWKRFEEIKPPEQMVTIASIFGRANELDPTWWDRWDEAEYEALEARCAQAEEKQGMRQGTKQRQQTKLARKMADIAGSTVKASAVAQAAILPTVKGVMEKIGRTITTHKRLVRRPAATSMEVTAREVTATEKVLDHRSRSPNRNPIPKVVIGRSFIRTRSTARQVRLCVQSSHIRRVTLSPC